jgi:anaerobic selenocysteine-containing dehydrogenase
VERITGVPVAELYETVEALATAQTAMILTARGAEQHSSGTDTAQAFINLALALGLPASRVRATERSPARAMAKAAASTARRLINYRAIASWPIRTTARTWPACGA